MIIPDQGKKWWASYNLNEFISSDRKFQKRSYLLWQNEQQPFLDIHLSTHLSPILLQNSAPQPLQRDDYRWALVQSHEEQGDWFIWPFLDSIYLFDTSFICICFGKKRIIFWKYKIIRKWKSEHFCVSVRHTAGAFSVLHPEVKNKMGTGLVLMNYFAYKLRIFQCPFLFRDAYHWLYGL